MLEHIMLEHMSNKLSEYMSNRISAGGGQCFFSPLPCLLPEGNWTNRYIYIYNSYDGLRWSSWCQNLPLFQTLLHQRVQVGLPELGRCWEVLEPIAVERGRLSCASESPRGVQEFSLRSLGFRGKFIENMRQCCCTKKGGVLPVFPLTKSGSTLLHF